MRARGRWALVALAQHALPVIVRRRLQPDGPATPLQQLPSLAVEHQPAAGGQDAGFRFGQETSQYFAGQPAVVGLAMQREDPGERETRRLLDQSVELEERHGE